jgi:hypothetical protein
LTTHAELAPTPWFLVGQDGHFVETTEADWLIDWARMCRRHVSIIKLDDLEAEPTFGVDWFCRQVGHLDLQRGECRRCLAPSDAAVPVDSLGIPAPSVESAGSGVAESTDHARHGMTKPGELASGKGRISDGRSHAWPAASATPPKPDVAPAAPPDVRTSASGAVGGVPDSADPPSP